jgi:hypothetical protein
VIGRLIPESTEKILTSISGAGISGINAAILLPAKVPGIDLTIFEKNDDVVYLFNPSVTGCYLMHLIKGGTWLENIYPGVRW